MPPTKLPSEHYIVRNASWAKLRKDENDKVIGVLGEAFRMRKVDTYLSTTWLEYFPGPRGDKITAAVHAMRASKLTIPTRSGFAIGKVGKIADAAAASKNAYKLRVLHEPAEDNKAHVAVRRFPPDDVELFEVLAIDAWSEVILNSAIPEGEAAAPDAPAWVPPEA